jgi:hypothetical protein
MLLWRGARMLRIALVSVPGFVLFASAASGGVDPFHALLRPESSVQEVESLFELSFEVDETARQFNGYEIRLHWDPDVLSLDSVREGSLMADACANNFTNLTFTDSTAVYSHVLLCGGVSLDGPGVLSIFTFGADAVGSTVVDLVSDPDRTFFDDGLFISPAHPTYPRQVHLFDATVTVGTSAGVEPGLAETFTFEIRVVPNPVRGDATLELRFEDSMREALSADGTVRLEISDVSGRRVARWSIAAGGAGKADVLWKAVDRNGVPLPAGPYFYRARVGRDAAQGKILVIR